ncbi:uncharacterized protein NPIL_575181 [Nephila pilipes]|uniref:Uncharacterized protein n=1 Tax=Nephila pilipes TaxID=299642 RepID=A0A8X6QMQ5_NEPPI|nr:uncharacterized protein NPIL_575181 [Nephila pilipes]
MWVTNHSSILSCSVETSSFHWISSGKINYEATAKFLIRNEKIDIKEQYALASFYCFKDDAISLWKNGRITSRDLFLVRDVFSCLGIWNKWVKQESPFDWDKLTSNERMDSHYHLGVRTLFPELSRTKKINWLKYAIQFENIDTAQFLFCLFHLDDNEKEDIYKEYPCHTILYFLDYPFQSEFLEVADRLFQYLSGNMFFFVLHFLIYKRMIREFNDYNYLYLFVQFWDRSPMHLKQYIQLKNIYQVVQLAIHWEDITSFCEKDFVKLCQNIDFAFHSP